MTENEDRWAKLRQAHPATADKLLKGLRDVSQGRRTWAEVLQIQDAELLGMAKMAAAKLEMGRAAEAERTFWALTALDPFVPWFWMALGDARARLSKLTEAIDAYGQCIREASQMQPASTDDIRAASLRRGRLLARAKEAQAALEDFRTVLALDTPSAPDGEQALLAIEALVAAGELPEQVLQGLPVHR